MYCYRIAFEKPWDLHSPMQIGDCKLCPYSIHKTNTSPLCKETQNVDKIKRLKVIKYS